MIVGTADGPFNLLLNSLAMFFILECDDIIDFDKPDSGYFGSLRLAIWQQHVAWQAQVQDILGDVADRVGKLDSRHCSQISLTGVVGRSVAASAGCLGASRRLAVDTSPSCRELSVTHVMCRHNL